MDRIRRIPPKGANRGSFWRFLRSLRFRAASRLQPADLLPITVAGLALHGCGGDGNGITDTPAPAAVATVVVAPSSQSVPVGQSVQFTATLRDASGNTLTGRTVTWSSSATSVATVDAGGLATGRSPGSTTIRATSEGVSGSSALAVTPQPIAAIVLAPAADSVAIGDTIRFTATARDGAGNTLTDRTFAWSSSDEAVAIVTQDGVATGLALGTSTIRASAEGVSGTAELTVEGAPFSGAWAMVSAGREHSCGLDTEGKAFCWGWNGESQLGDGGRIFEERGEVTANTPFEVAGGLRFSSISAGADHTCALSTDGRAFCWGENGSGELGAPGSTRNAPVQVADPAGGPVTWQALEAASDYTCGVSSAGELYCWGDNADGQLGTDPAVASSPIPLLIDQFFANTDGQNQGPFALQGVTGVAVDNTHTSLLHTCATFDAADLMACWGNNEFAQIGLGFASRESVPYPSARFQDVKEVAVGAWSSCIIVSSGVAGCWGGNHLGRLGIDDPSADTVLVPTPVAGGILWDAIGIGWLHACGLSTSGQAFCWGEADDGKLGTGVDCMLCRSEVPVQVQTGETFQSLSVGWLHACAVTPDGRAYCWGRGGLGRLGDGQSGDRYAPSRIKDPG